jgi:hypothetical protein
VTPALRKLALTAHVTFSVGWLGAVVAYLVLAVAAAASGDVQAVRSAWLAMQIIGWYAIVPLALAALLVGLVNALGTSWGLFRHYWVLLKFLLTVLATIILLSHMPSVTVSANAAEAGSVVPVGLGRRNPARRRRAAGADRGDRSVGLQASRPHSLRLAQAASPAGPVRERVNRILHS